MTSTTLLDKVEEAIRSAGATEEMIAAGVVHDKLGLKLV
jgi:hypothetical protein